MTVTYTYSWYRQFLEQCKDVGHSFMAFKEGEANGIRLRHDVDFSPRSALRMARIEEETGAIATYFFLITGSFYNALSPNILSIIREITGLGHTVGLHFHAGTYFDAEPHHVELYEQIEADRAIFRPRVQQFTDTVSFHNPPDWVLGESFEGVTHTYEPTLFCEDTFRSDSLGRWRREPPFPDGIVGGTQVLIHPGLWGETDEDMETRIRSAQQEALDRIDESMRSGSRLDWSYATLDW